MSLEMCSGNNRHEPVVFESDGVKTPCPVCQLKESIEDKQGEVNEIARALDLAIDTMRQALDGRRKMLIQMEIDPAMRESVPMFTAAEVDKWGYLFDSARADLENFSILD